MVKERTQAEIRDICEKACAILRKTNDGNDLDPSDLKLTELAVNGLLNAAGHEIFEKLYRRVVVNENYIKPYLHDIEHLTRDHDGYIYYKGIHVEHYDRDYVYSEAGKDELEELKRRCEFLERKGVPVSSETAVWCWDKYADEYCAERLRELDALLGNETQSLLYSCVEIYNSGREFIYYVCGQPKSLEEIKNHPVTKDMIGRYSDDEYEITVKSFIYEKRQAYRQIPIEVIKDTMVIENLLASCHNYLRTHNKLEILPEITHKTDYAAGYELTKRLDNMIDSPGRSLQYSEVFMYGYGSDGQRLYICGIPNIDEVKAYPEYESMMAHCGDRLTVSVTTYQYGKGEPLTPDEMKYLLTAPFIETLGEAHYYLKKHNLSREIGWKDLTRGLEVNQIANADPDYEAENGYEL